ERDLARNENLRLRERVKQLNMVHKRLEREVCELLDEREALKRFIAKGQRVSSPRGRPVSSTSSSRASLGVNVDRLLEAKNGAHKNGDTPQEDCEGMLQEDSPESGARARCSSQELLRQLKRQGYAATRAAMAPARRAEPGDRGAPGLADLMALPKETPRPRQPQCQEDVLQAYATWH
ncbi:unnamed protein product, partial [Effrenium voratum]